jgi:hypothetical protein
MNYTNIDWIKTNCTKIHPFGLGFIQVKLNDSERMHFYHPDFQREREELHNHRYDFRSTIIRGVLYQEIYEFCNTRETLIPPTHELYETDCLSHKEEVVIQGQGIPMLEYSGYHSVGSEYSLPHSSLHRVEAQSCVTFLRRGAKVKATAQVVREIGTVPACPFSEKIEESQMWEMVYECLYK